AVVSCEREGLGRPLCVNAEGGIWNLEFRRLNPIAVGADGQELKMQIRAAPRETTNLPGMYRLAFHAQRAGAPAGVERIGLVVENAQASERFHFRLPSGPGNGSHEQICIGGAAKSHRAAGKVQFVSQFLRKDRRNEAEKTVSALVLVIKSLRG